MRTVETIEELQENLSLLRMYATSSNKHENEYFLDLVRNGTCFVFDPRHDGDIFAPSRFIGYASNTWQRHEQNETKNGGPTNKAIERLLGARPVEDAKLESAYGEFCERLGFHAPRTGSFGAKRKYWRLPHGLRQADAALHEAVLRSQNDKQRMRLARLENAPRFPARTQISTFVFERNPDVVAEVLARAKGRCERCLQPAPFVRINGEPYLEVHHKIQLAAGGPDTVDNAVAICPNCHRECHFGAGAPSLA